MLFLSELNFSSLAFIVLVSSLFLLIRIPGLIEYIKERKRRLEFKKFEEVISGTNTDPATAKKYFSGEVKLPEDIYVIIPQFIAKAERKTRFETPINEALQQAGIGKVIRGFETDESCGFDVHVTDFISGVDLIRKQLVALQAPNGTLIEYSGGDLQIYDN